MKQRLTAKEEEVMNIIWAKGEVFIRDIVAALPDPKPNYNTVATQVKFLEDKGFVKRKPMANSFQYSPALTERDYHGTTVGGRCLPLLQQLLHQPCLPVRRRGQDGCGGP